MNTDEGSFQKFDDRLLAEHARENIRRSAQVKRPHDIFEVGERITIKNSIFEVEKIEKKFITLRVLATPYVGGPVE